MVTPSFGKYAKLLSASRIGMENLERRRLWKIDSSISTAIYYISLLKMSPPESPEARKFIWYKIKLVAIKLLAINLIFVEIQFCLFLPKIPIRCFLEVKRLRESCLECCWELFQKLETSFLQKVIIEFSQR